MVDSVRADPERDMGCLDLLGCIHGLDDRGQAVFGLLHSAGAPLTVDDVANQSLATQNGVRGVPTLVLFADGRPVERLVGMQDEARLHSVVEQHA